MSPKLISFRYKHTVSLTFTGGKGLGLDSAAIVDGCETDTEVLPQCLGSSCYKCWLKRDITLVISSIHFAEGEETVVAESFLLRCGGESDNRPHNVAVECFGSSIILPTPLPLPSRMGLYLSIPNGLSVMLVGTAASDVPAPVKEGGLSS